MDANRDLEPARRAGRGTERWLSRLARIEAPAVRTTAAAVLPLIIGQNVRQPGAGLMIGLGGLYVSITDKPGASARSLLLSTVVAALAICVGTAVDHMPWLATPLTLAVAFGAGMARVWGDLAGQIAFMSALVFAVGVGLPGGDHAAVDRLLQYGVGGLWGTALTLLLWRWVPPAPHLPPEFEGGLRNHLTWRSPVFQHSVRLAVAAGLSVAVYKLFRLERGYWLILTVLIILKPDFAATHTRAVERVVGSFVGGALAVLLAAKLRNLAVIDGLLILLSLVAYSQLPSNYGLFVVFLTPFVVLMINTVDPGDWRVALLRIGDTAIGGVLAWVTAYVLQERTVRRIRPRRPAS